MFGSSFLKAAMVRGAPDAAGAADAGSGSSRRQVATNQSVGSRSRVWVTTGAVGAAGAAAGAGVGAAAGDGAGAALALAFGAGAFAGETAAAGVAPPPTST